MAISDFDTREQVEETNGKLFYEFMGLMLSMFEPEELDKIFLISEDDLD